MTHASVRSILLQLWPPGRLYDWSTPTSNVSRFLDALAEAVKVSGFDVVDRLRRELNPATAVEKLPDWEDALGIAGSYTARNGTIAQRQAAVVAKLREFGALTRANVRAIVAPLFGYVDASALAVLETPRSAMRAAHTYTDGRSYPSANGISASVVTADGGVVSRAGAQLDLNFATAPTQPFVVSLHSPTQRFKQWTSASLGPASTNYRLYAPEFSGDACGGTWSVSILALSFMTTVPALSSWSIFVEGSGRSGLGGDIATWGVFVDPALAGKNGVPADVDAARAAISRVKHAHTVGLVVTSLAAIPDDPSSLPDACLPA